MCPLHGETPRMDRIDKVVEFFDNHARCRLAGACAPCSHCIAMLDCNSLLSVAISYALHVTALGMSG